MSEGLQYAESIVSVCDNQHRLCHGENSAVSSTIKKLVNIHHEF